MKLILDTLERARLAASPAEADALRVALIDLETLADVLSARGIDLDDVPAALAERQALREHVQTQPFDVSDTGQDEFDAVTIQETTPGAFTDWLATLERLAR